MIYTSDVDYVLRYNNRNDNRHERQAKYMLCRSLGFNFINSMRMRDWTISHIALASQRLIIKCSGDEHNE
jgi:hypothetical protein